MSYVGSPQSTLWAAPATLTVHSTKPLRELRVTVLTSGNVGVTASDNGTALSPSVTRTQTGTTTAFIMGAAA